MRFSDRRTMLAILTSVLIVAGIASGPYLFGRFRGDPISIRVDLSERTLYVLENGEVVESYGVAIGTPSHPTPTGSFRTGRIDWNPRWVPPPSDWARGQPIREPGDPRNPMQGVKIYFREPYYFIHGTNDPASIGTAASHGCLRMTVSAAKELARRIADQGSASMVIVS